MAGVLETDRLMDRHTETQANGALTGKSKFQQLLY